MTVVTLRPSSTISNTDVEITGSATAHGAVSDNSDSSYLEFNDADDQVVFGLQDLTLPAGAALIGASLRLRGHISTNYMGFGGLSVRWPTGAEKIFAATLITWTTPVTWVMSSTTDPPSDAQIDASTLQLFFGGSVFDPDEDDGGSGDGFDFYFGDAVRVIEVLLDITYVLQPVVVVTTPTEGSTITNTNRPQVAWTRTLDSAGGAQQFYEVKIFAQAVYSAGGFDPNTSTAISSASLSGTATSWDSAVRLPDGLYRAYVRIGQVLSGPGRSALFFASEWDYNQFEIDVPSPSEPQFWVTPEPEEGRIRLDIEHVAGAQVTEQLEVQRSIDHLTWEPLRLDTDTAGVINAADATVFDFEAANGQTVFYRVRAINDDDGLAIVSDWVEGDGQWDSTEWWLKSPLHPSLNMPIVIHSQPGFQAPARQGNFQALGATRALTISDTRGADRGQLVLRADSDVEAVALYDILQNGGILLAQGASGAHWRDRYVTIGDVDMPRLVDRGFIEGWLPSLPWIEVDPPTGPLDEWPDYAS